MANRGTVASVAEAVLLCCKLFNRSSAAAPTRVAASLPWMTFDINKKTRNRSFGEGHVHLGGSYASASQEACEDDTLRA